MKDTSMLSQVKEYLRIDGSEDDRNLTLLLDAAKEWLADSGVPEKDTSLYQVTVLIYVALQYDPDTYKRLEPSLERNVLTMRCYGDHP
ncbi:hypothetical protein IIU_05738 [Bacillus cereus VD133]|uniref:Phage protein n=1 Tax=Bacillus cereus VD133 TaxID=1053233 RepID=A0A9W5PLD7_BACCE|nr:head-tail connector protein [Bacillus cereus]EOO28620.1 hypothetical protein IIU_05738 [Bacillus cereus VD133]